MSYGLLFRTVVYLRPTQLLYQIKRRLIKQTIVLLEATVDVVPKLSTLPLSKYHSLENDKFTFLNVVHEFAGWNYTDNGMLWAYNQNYFDWINQKDLSVEDGGKWIDRFIEELPGNKVGLDSYPIALRSINWVKFFCKNPECATKNRLDSLFSQLKLLEKKLEYHLLGNHLLEDAFALYIGASFFNDEQLFKKASKLLKAQLKEQVLPDGAHYEQSPMYHCILLDRLLDCINIKSDSELVEYAQRMLGHLESIVWSNKSIPLLNDAAIGIAPTPEQIFDYAKRLGLQWRAMPLKESGYRKLFSGSLEAIVDVGNITATYQPGHTHADTFNYELRIDGKPFIVDTGTSTYNKTGRRQVERSTMAHNCVSVGGKDSSEVWGGFRVGRRCQVKITEDTKSVIDSTHNGFEKSCRRRFEMKDDVFCIEDWYDGEAVSYIHLSERVDEKRVNILNAISVEIKPWEYSVEYNKFLEGKVIVIKFKNYLKYTIK